MEEMPKKTKFLLQFESNIYGTTYECEPDNWADVELGLSRKDFAVNKEITSEFIFSGTAGKIIKLIYDTSGYKGVLTMVMYKLQNDWSYETFHTFTADFKTFMWDRKAHITFKENDYLKQLEDNKGIDYTFTMPTTTKLSYSGVNTIRTNTIKVIPAVLNYTLTKARIIKGARIVSNTSLYYDFSPVLYYVPSSTVSNYDHFAINTIRAKTSTYNVRIGTLTIEVQGRLLTPWSRVELVKVNSALTTTIIKAWLSISTLYNSERDVSTVLFSDGATYTYDIATAAGDMIYLRFYDTDIDNLQCTIIEGTTTLSVVSDEESAFQEYSVNAVTHQWLLGQILDKINPNISLTYNLPDSSDTVSTLLVPASSLRNQSTQEITCSFEKVMKSLKCLYCADYKFEGQTLTVDYPSMFFSNSKAMDVVPILTPEISYSTNHVYNKVTVGYETDDDIINGEYEFNCKNTFTLNSSVSNELDLIHPFKGSMYTIEQYLSNKSNDNKTDDKDTDIFIFAVGTYTTTATLYRNLTSTTLPETAYNVPISPMRMLIANGAYLGVSMYKGTSEAVFQSSDRLANVTTQCGFESAAVKENNGGAAEPLGVAMATPLFLPETIEFETSLKLWDMSTINDNLYKYFEITDLKTNIVHKFYISDISIRLTRVNSQNWIGWTVN